MRVLHFCRTGIVKQTFFTERMRLMFHADRLIAAFDGSDDSKKALQKAIDLSKTFHADLTVVHSHNAKDTQTIVDPREPGQRISAAGLQAFLTRSRRKESPLIR